MAKNNVRILSLLFLIGISVSTAGGFVWRSDVNKAFKESEEKRRPLFIYFYHPFSLKEDNRVFMSPLLKKYEELFVSVQVNIDSKGAMATKYGATLFPCILFFDPKGREIYALRYEEEKLKQTELAVRLKRVLASVEEFSMLESQAQNLMDNPQLLLQYAKGLRDRVQFEPAEGQFNRLLQMKDLSTELKQQVREGFINMLFLQATRDFYAGQYDRCIDTMRRVLDKYPKDNTNYQAKFLLGMALVESGDTKTGEPLLRELSRDKDAGIFQEKAVMYLNRKKGGKAR